MCVRKPCLFILDDKHVLIVGFHEVLFPCHPAHRLGVLLQPFQLLVVLLELLLLLVDFRFQFRYFHLSLIALAQAMLTNEANQGNEDAQG